MKINIIEQDLKKWGIYKIKNIITGDFYIGSTIQNFDKRIKNHINDFNSWLKNKNRRAICPILYKAFAKYGIDNFEFSVEISFLKKNNSLEDKKFITNIEEKYINDYQPKYNICKKPTLSGCPNLGKKLSEEWKKKIQEKSKLYKHSKNQEVYNKKKQQNKNLSTKIRIYKEEFDFTGSILECALKFNVNRNTIRKWYKKGINKNNFKIELIKNQKKSIKLIISNKEYIFSSFSECDKFLGMWRGFTSTQVVNNKERILDFEYQILKD